MERTCRAVSCHWRQYGRDDCAELRFELQGGEDEIASLTLACTYAAPGPFCSRMFELWRDMARRMSIADVMRDVALWAFTMEFFADERRGRMWRQWRKR